MNYYTLSFNKITEIKPGIRQWDWYLLHIVAPNRKAAKQHGEHVASVEGVKFVDAMRELKVVGIVKFNKMLGFHKLP